MPYATEPRSSDDLRQSIRFELDGFAVMTSIAGSIGNAIERHVACEFAAPDIMIYLPAGVGLQTATSRFAPQDASDREISAGLAALRARAEFARDLASTLEVTHGPGHARLAPIADAARRLASLCFVVRNAFDRHDVNNTCIGGQLPRRRIDQMLRLVSAGATPCLDVGGRLSVPGWAERRSVGRHTANAEIVIVHRGTKLAASVEDISAAGIGVSGALDLSAGDRVEVQFGSGVVQKAHVIWAVDDRAGLTFAQQLDPSIVDAITTIRGLMAS